MSRATPAADVQALGAASAALRPPSPIGRTLAVLRATLLAATLIVVAGVTVWRLFPASDVLEQALRDLSSLLILVLVVLILVLGRLGVGRPGGTIEIVAPVHGRWRALSSPATKVPSHGTHEGGQTWALDIVAAPEGVASPVFGGLRGPLPPEAFPAFGQPVFAGGDGTVVLARDGAPDRASRNSWLLLPLFLLESLLRGVGGQRFVFGNLLVIGLDHGGYQALAHLQRGSIGPAVGDRVTAGQAVARCGNSGNSTEPHLHLQLMNRPVPTFAVGYPFAMRGIRLEGADPDAPGEPGTMPARGQAFNG